MPRSRRLLVSLLAIHLLAACHCSDQEAVQVPLGSTAPSLEVPSNTPTPSLGAPAHSPDVPPEMLPHAYGFEPKLTDWILTPTEESTCGLSWSITPRLGQLQAPAKLEACYGPDPYQTIRVRTDCVKKGTLQSPRHVIELCLNQLRRTTASGWIDILQIYDDGLGPRLRVSLSRFPRDSVSSLIDQIASSRSRRVPEISESGREQIRLEMRGLRDLVDRAPSVFLNGLYSDHD